MTKSPMKGYVDHRMDNLPTRLSGVVVSVYPSTGKYGGSFGEIQAEDGRHYVFSAGQVYRNGSRAVIGAKVTFEAIAFGSYATNIDSTRG